MANSNYNPNANRTNVDFSGINNVANKIGSGLTGSSNMEISSIGSGLSSIAQQFAQSRSNFHSGLNSNVANTQELADLARTQTQQAMAGDGVLTESAMQRADRGVQQQTANTLGDIQSQFRANIELDEFQQNLEVKNAIAGLVGSPELEAGLINAGIMNEGDGITSFTGEGLDYMAELGFDANQIGTIAISGMDFGDDVEVSQLAREELGNMLYENGGQVMDLGDGEVLVGGQIINVETGKIGDANYESWLKSQNLGGFDHNQDKMFEDIFSNNDLTDSEKIMIVKHIDDNRHQHDSGNNTFFQNWLPNALKWGDNEVSAYGNSNNFKNWFSTNFGKEYVPPSSSSSSSSSSSNNTGDWAG